VVYSVIRQASFSLLCAKLLGSGAREVKKAQPHP
jgi:hypothetical protein